MKCGARDYGLHRLIQVNLVNPTGFEQQQVQHFGILHSAHSVAICLVFI